MLSFFVHQLYYVTFFRHTFMENAPHYHMKRDVQIHVVLSEAEASYLSMPWRRGLCLREISGVKNYWFLEVQVRCRPLIQQILPTWKSLADACNWTVHYTIIICCFHIIIGSM